MRIVWTILRIYSYVFEVLLALVLLALGIAGATNNNNLDLGMLPWTGAALTKWLIALGIIGIVCVLLAATGWFRYLYPLWTLFVLVMLIRGFFLSSYRFSGESGFKEAIWITVAALVAFIASLSVLGRAFGRSATTTARA